MSNNWTLITAYFDLTKCPDASIEIKKRDMDYYLKHMKSTMVLPYNMIIYCDEASFPKLYDLRPTGKKTKYVIRNFDEFEISGMPFSKLREKIKENRIQHPYQFDNRNTPSYYLFCMSRYIMLKEIMDENPYSSTHFAWINICIERMGKSNIAKLPEALALNRDKFSTCYIDYIPEAFVRNTGQYFQRGLCSMCSGFFTGNKEYMGVFCDLIIAKFVYYLDQGYGHSDETLYSPVYFDNPEIFQHYYGDYTEMITNYSRVYENPASPLRNFIQNSFRFGDNRKCFEACSVVWESFKEKKCQLTKEELEKLCYYYMLSQS
jgi:hypothetical protein